MKSYAILNPGWDLGGPNGNNRTARTTARNRVAAYNRDNPVPRLHGGQLAVNPHDLALRTWLFPQPVIVASDHRSAGYWWIRPIIGVDGLRGVLVVLVLLHIWPEPWSISEEEFGNFLIVEGK